MSDLTQEYVKNLFDYRDGKLYWKVARKNIYIGKQAGHIKPTGITLVGFDNKTYLIHRIIYLYWHGEMPEFIDHIDGNPGNNKIENLRRCTKSENNWNSVKRKDNSSGIKGISWHKKDGKWHARLMVDKQNVYLGAYTDIAEAAKAVTLARAHYHGAFAKQA